MQHCCLETISTCASKWWKSVCTIVMWKRLLTYRSTKKGGEYTSLPQPLFHAEYHAMRCQSFRQCTVIERGIVRSAKLLHGECYKYDCSGVKVYGLTVFWCESPDNPHNNISNFREEKKKITHTCDALKWNTMPGLRTCGTEFGQVLLVSHAASSKLWWNGPMTGYEYNYLHFLW